VQAGLPLLDQVLDETGDWRLRTEAQHFRCRILMWGGQPVAGRDLLIAEANQVEAQDPAWSAAMRAHAALTSAMLGDQRLAAAEGQRAVELLAGLPGSSCSRPSSAGRPGRPRASSAGPRAPAYP
jgi:hypothetical protein